MGYIAQSQDMSSSQPFERCFLVLLAPCLAVSHFDAGITFPTGGMTDLVWHPSMIQEIDEVCVSSQRNVKTNKDRATVYYSQFANLPPECTPGRGSESQSVAHLTSRTTTKPRGCSRRDILPFLSPTTWAVCLLPSPQQHRARRRTLLAAWHVLAAGKRSCGLAGTI
ncbi:uncharacterized protein CLUP02_02587 [Colletotrichum lupini]|uniref:Uncharacterized protein n=1 Tax=Colletotrichum lupini TaxID=145971 RepID=A0A9Q8WC26_9PEZI|nr:uncharacterized protein CLUP02_02587 [Colletotrichum lupini]UQC77120.1 hypothetical protein CLUP02_02587 [Colletotrichum lupini]